MITDRGWLDMFETGGEFINRIDVHTAFVGKGSSANKGGAWIVMEIGQFVDKGREFGKLPQIALRQDFLSKFELEKGKEGGQVAISCALSVPVDRALDLKGAFLDGGDGIGDPESTVVVGMDSQFQFWKAGLYGANDRTDFGGRRPPLVSQRTR